MTELHSRRLERRDLLVALLLFAVAVVLLLATRALHQSGDSLAYAHAIKTGLKLFHPHHLLYSPIVRAIYLPLHSTHGGFDAILVAQLHNAFWAAVAVSAIFGIVRIAGGSRGLAVGAAVLLLACRGFAVYATQVEVYLPAVGCATLLLFVLLRDRAARGFTLSSWPLVALLSLLVFYHQTNVLLCVPLLVFLALRGGRAGSFRGLRIVAAAGGLVLVTYVVVYALEEGPATAAGFFDFTLRYAVGPYSPHWGTGGNLGASGITELIDSQIRTIAHLKRSMAARTIFALLAGAVVVWNGFGIARTATGRAYRAFLLLWLLVYGGFFLWWQPSEHEFFVMTLVPLLLLLAQALIDLCAATGSAAAAPVAAGVLFVVGGLALLPATLADSVLPAHRGRGPSYGIAGEYMRVVPAGCIHLNGRQVTQSLRYYFDLDPEEAINVKLYRRRFLQPAIDDDVPPFPPERCLAVPLFDALPPSATVERNIDDPLAWLEYYRWLFRLERVGELLSAPPVTARRMQAGPILLIQQGPPLEFDGLSGFFAAMRTGEAARQLAAFSEWLEANRAPLAAETDPAFLGPVP